jgi:hypothetical protein
MNIVVEKFKEVISSVLPVVVIVMLFIMFVNPVSLEILTNFSLGTIYLIMGLTIFLVGVDISVIPFGQLTGPTIAKKNKISYIIIFGLILGFTISIAEPSLIVLANQVSIITGGYIANFILVAVVSLGLAFGMIIGLMRIIYNWPIHRVLLVLYTLIFILSYFVSDTFFNIAFDASGSTTGVLAVPFILALGRGITLLKKNSKASSKDSFGLVSISSAGAIVSVMILSFFINIPTLNDVSIVNEVISKNTILINTIIESTISLLPIAVIFILMNIFYFKLKGNKFRKVIIGFIYTYLGLVLFLYGINSGFMEMAFIMGSSLANNTVLLLLFAFIIGFTTILAEPAIHILMGQIEDVTSGYVHKKLVLYSLSIGVGLAILISVIKILYPSILLWHLLLPLYIVALILNYITPKLFVGISFDAGGVATGPMTATFILAFINGITSTLNTNSLINGFGMISLVAIVPVIVIQILGIIFKIKSQKEMIIDGKETI